MEAIPFPASFRFCGNLFCVFDEKAAYWNQFTRVSVNARPLELNGPTTREFTMNVGNLLSEKGSDIIALERGCSVMEVAKLLGERRIGAIPITENGMLCGIMSERDVVRGIAIRGGGVLADDASTLMTKSVFTCTREDTIYELMKMMTERRIRHVPVVEDGKLIGMVSIGDVVKFRMEEATRENEALKDYIGQA